MSFLTLTCLLHYVNQRSGIGHGLLWNLCLWCFWEPAFWIKISGGVGWGTFDCCQESVLKQEMFGFYFREEADEYIEIGALNGIFVLGRSMGFIGKSWVVPTISCTHHGPNKYILLPVKKQWYSWERSGHKEFSFNVLPFCAYPRKQKDPRNPLALVENTFLAFPSAQKLYAIHPSSCAL